MDHLGGSGYEFIAFFRRTIGGQKWESILRVPGAQPTNTEIVCYFEKNNNWDSWMTFRSFY